MFIPNTKGRLARKTGRTRQGEPIFGPFTTVECAIVRLSRLAGKTSVRADSSASRGNAEELTMSDAKILFPANSPIQIGDRFQIASYDLEVISREPRISMGGVLDHLECDFGIFTDEEL